MNFELNKDILELRDRVREFVAKEITPYAHAMDEENGMREGLLQKAAELGLLTLSVPKEYGGACLDAVSVGVIYEEVAKGCAGVATTFAANSLALLPVLIGGNEEQKKAFCGLLKEGKLGAFALTEPAAGSDAGGVKTRAVFNAEKNTYTLNGNKCFITNAGLAEVFVVLANTREDGSMRGLTAFIVPKNTKGLSIGQKENKMGIRASDTRSMKLENVEVPASAIIGKPGLGFRLAMETLEIARPYAGILAVGVAQSALDSAIAFAKGREQFGKPIGSFEMIQAMLADMSMKVETARLLVYKALWLKDEGLDFGKESAMAKCYAGDMAMQVTTDAVQIMGGYGYSKTGPVEKLMRDAKVMQIYEGTNQVQRLIIAGKLLK